MNCDLTPRRRLAVLAIVLTTTVLVACNDGSNARARAVGADRETITNDPDRGAAATGETTVSTVIDARPAAVVNGRSVTWGDLRPALNEIAGAQALQEFVLDRELLHRLAERNLVITPDDAQRERRRMLDSLSDDPETAIRLLRELRERRGLGEKRFESFLFRNAALRAIVASRVEVSATAVNEMYEIEHGPKRQARVIVVASFNDAEGVVQRLRSRESFADVAVRYSTDSSAARGGLLEPISQRDPSYPESLRNTLFSLQLGDASSPILHENGYMIVQYEKEIPGDGMSFEVARPELERLVRVSIERVLMDDLARRILVESSVTIFDDQLRYSWQRAKGQLK